MDGLLDHQRDEPAELARHRVLAVRADRHQLDSPQGTKMIEQLADHLEDVDGRVPLEERNAYEMDVEQDTPDAGADANVEERRVEVSGAVADERECPDLVIVQNIRQDLQVCANVHADHLADLMIVEAGKSRVAERILVVGDHSGRLPEGQANRRVLQHQIVQGGVGDLGHVRPIRLLLEQLHGIGFGDGLQLFVLLVQLWLEEHVADDHLDDVFRHGDAQSRLSGIQVVMHRVLRALLGVEEPLLLLHAERRILLELLLVLRLDVGGEVVLAERR